MKTIKTLAILIVCIGLLFSASSCTIVYFKKDNGKHRGWYKNPNNPHNPRHQNHPNESHPEKQKGKSKPH